MPNKIIIGLTLPAIALSLSACATSGAGLSGRPDRIQAELAPVCPTPTQWTKAEENAVARTIDHNATNQGMILLVDEWDRLNTGAMICRGIQ